MEPTYVYKASVVRVVDGDTLDLFVDLGFRTWQKIRVRLYGVDTPETYGVKKESAEYEAGMAAKKFVEQWLGLVIEESNEQYCHIILNPSPVTIRSHDGKELGQGKYGRWIVEVMREDDDCSLNEALLDEGHAVAVRY